jgi:hypothetical protein
MTVMMAMGGDSNGYSNKDRNSDNHDATAAANSNNVDDNNNSNSRMAIG